MVKASKAPRTGVVVVDVATTRTTAPSTVAAWVSTDALRLVLDAPRAHN
ncbi:hypothetical protein LV779_18370 [Streptomyces thinghirensis]|nr:hypothetical protein [Streptomyces thinghirensis]